MGTEFIGKRLRDIDYNNLYCNGLSIYQNGKEITCGSIGEVLRRIPHLANEIVKDTNIYFDILVLRV
jgi:hypothetical protein